MESTQTAFCSSELADLIGCRDWQIRRMVRRGDIAAPGRMAGRMIFSSDAIPEIVAACKKFKYIAADAEFAA